MVRRSVACIAAALLGLAVAAGASEMPPSPEGFSWRKFEPVKAAFLVPDGWFVKEEKAEGLRAAFFITKEPIAAGGQFETGLTVNVQTFEKDPAPLHAAQFIAGLTSTHEVLDTTATEVGVLKGFGCRVKVVEEGYPPMIMQALAIGNSRTNTLYILIFESPEKGWDEAWAKGEVILKEFLLDDEI